MALFDRSKTLEKTVKEINATTHYDLYEDTLRVYVDKIGNEEFFCNLLLKVVANPNTENVFLTIGFIVDKIYVLFVKTNKFNKDEFNNLVDFYLNHQTMLIGNVLDNIQMAFDNKSLVFEILNYFDCKFGSDLNDGSNIEALTEYLVRAREFYIDDRALLSSLFNLVDRIGVASIKYDETAKIIKKSKEKLKEDKKANGIYDIDQAKLQEIDRKIETLSLTNERLKTLIETAEHQEKSLNISIDNISNELSKTKIEELKVLREEANNIIKGFHTSYLQLLEQEKSAINLNTEEIMSEIDKEVEERKITLSRIGETITKKVELELTKINSLSRQSIQKIKDFVESDDSVKKMLNEAKSDNEFLETLKQVEKLVNEQQLVATTVQTPVVQPVSVLNGLEIPSIVVPNREVNNKFNYYFDPTIPYKERLKKLTEKKQKLMEEKGEIYHEKFDDILAMILQNDSPYMYGPSGCGKTYMIEKQLSELLDINILINGYIMYEQDVIGYTNAGTGGYVESNFYRCFKYGDTIFFDELDNGIANATTVLNSFLTSKVGSLFVFPNGEQVKRNPNFRIIAAGNTKGSGKTLAHNTRQKMDESVMQRLTPIEVNYDNRIEKVILSKYPGWYEFAEAFRKAVESCGSADEKNTIGTFTTRDAETIRKHKDDGSFTDEKLMDYQIIENKDIDYLNQIKRNINNYEFDTSDGKKLLKIFNNKVNEKAEER